MPFLGDTEVQTERKYLETIFFRWLLTYVQPWFCKIKKKKAILNKWISSFVTFLCGQCDVCVR